MSARKLQAEIDKVFKRIAEGVAVFEVIYEKLMTSQNPAQKDKLESDLKKEIKKLQRLRDQVKTWAASNEIKDKKPLLEQRRLIETQMEKFKAVEKDLKTKAFSKEGLSAAAKLDPREQQKMETCNWLSNLVDELERQIEQLEAESETLQVGAKKSKRDSSKNERLGEVDHLIERHKWHQGKIELILRGLENGNLAVDEVLDLKDDIDYYVESNQDVDFAEDEHIYDELTLDEEMYNALDREDESDADLLDDEPLRSPVKEDRPEPPTPAKAKPVDAHPPTPVRKSSVPVAAKAPTPPTPAPVSAPAPAPPPALSPAATISVVPAKQAQPAPIGPQPTQPVVNTPTLKYASAAAAAAAVEAARGPGIQPLPPPPGLRRTGTNTPAPSTPVPGTPVASTPELAHSKPASSHGLPSAPPSAPASVPVEEPASAKEVTPEVFEPAPSTANGTEPSMEENVSPVSPPEFNAAEVAANLPPGLQDLIASFQAARTRSVAPPPITSVYQLLETSLTYVPDALDAQRPKHYTPENPYPTPSYYPQVPSPIFEEPMLFEKIDIDTLFYVFYYQQGTYQQYLAARELKRQSWRFHKKYLTWFQRHEEPKVITDEYESGTYRYFDFEGAWVQRKKPEFKFLYQHLEDEDKAVSPQ
ncbi:proteinral negative regulator of transcription subunit 5 [Saitoella coloradoensis]